MVIGFQKNGRNIKRNNNDNDNDNGVSGAGEGELENWVVAVSLETYRGGKKRTSQSVNVVVGKRRTLESRT